MEEILDLIRTHLAFLWEGNRFRFKDSFVTHEGNGVAELTLESDSLRLIFIRERGHISLDFQSKEEPRDSPTAFQAAHVRALLTSAPVERSEVESFGEFIRKNLDEIETMFRSPDYSKVKAELEEIRRERAVERFGPLRQKKKDS